MNSKRSCWPRTNSSLSDARVCSLACLVGAIYFKATFRRTPTASARGAGADREGAASGEISGGCASFRRPAGRPRAPSALAVGMLRGVEKKSACFVSASLALCCLARKSRHETFFFYHLGRAPRTRAELQVPKDASRRDLSDAAPFRASPSGVRRRHSPSRCFFKKTGPRLLRQREPGALLPGAEEPTRDVRRRLREPIFGNLFGACRRFAGRARGLDVARVDDDRI